MRVGVLRGVHGRRAVVVRAVVGVPVRALVAGFGRAQRLRLAHPVGGVEQHQPVVREGGVAHQPRSVAADGGVPGVERADSPHLAGVHVDADHAVRPLGGDDLPRTGAPRLVHDPLLGGRVPFVGQPVLTAVPPRHPDARVVGARVAEPLRVVGMELRVADAVRLQHVLGGAAAGIDHQHARALSEAHRHRPPAVVMADRGGPHGRSDVAVDPGAAVVEREELLLPTRGHLDPPAAADVGEVHVAAVVRGVDGPLHQTVVLGKLHQRPVLLQLHEDLRPSAAVRDEHQVPHGVVHRRQVVERVMTDRQVVGDLADAHTRVPIGPRASLRRVFHALHAAKSVGCTPRAASTADPEFPATWSVAPPARPSRPARR